MINTVYLNDKNCSWSISLPNSGCELIVYSVPLDDTSCSWSCSHSLQVVYKLNLLSHDRTSCLLLNWSWIGSLAWQVVSYCILCSSMSLYLNVFNLVRGKKNPNSPKSFFTLFPFFLLAITEGVLLKRWIWGNLFFTICYGCISLLLYGSIF